MFNKVSKNEFGFYTLKEKPTEEQLAEYYAQKYYQESLSSYAKTYSKEEFSYINNKIKQKHIVIESLLPGLDKNTPRFLDVGCGEGWALKYFKNQSWSIVGLDYSKYGCGTHNPDCLDSVIFGEINHHLDLLILEDKQFDVIWLDNVLEHVLEPLILLNKCQKLITDDGVLVVEVPNDFSAVQKILIDQSYVMTPFWVVSPDHISYFNKEGLEAIGKAAGWFAKVVISDFPIDLNLINVNTNYVQDKSKGKDCHKSRVIIENLLHELSPVKTNELYRVLAELGLGRQITAFFQKKG